MTHSNESFGMTHTVRVILLEIRASLQTRLH